MSRGDEGHAVLRGVTAKAKNMQLKDARAGDSNSRSGTFLSSFNSMEGLFLRGEGVVEFSRCDCDNCDSN